MDIRTALKTGIARLRDAGVPSYTLSGELLLLHVLGRERSWIYSHPEEELSGGARLDRQQSPLRPVDKRVAIAPALGLVGARERGLARFD